MDIDKIVSTYRKKSFWIIAGITLVVLLLAQIKVKEELYNIIIFNSVFALILSSTYIQIWKVVAKRSSKWLNYFYLASSTIRLLLTLTAAITGIILLGNERFELISFLLILSVFYVSMLVYDTTFFFFYEKNNRLNNKKG